MSVGSACGWLRGVRGSLSVPPQERSSAGRGRTPAREACCVPLGHGLIVTQVGWVFQEHFSGFPALLISNAVFVFRIPYRRPSVRSPCYRLAGGDAVRRWTCSSTEFTV